MKEVLDGVASLEVDVDVGLLFQESADVMAGWSDDGYADGEGG